MPDIYIPITNPTAELADCSEKWYFDEAYDCWCLEDLLYTQKAKVAAFQRLSIYVPRAYMKAGGVIVPDGKSGPYTAETAPVVFENNSGGYAQMPHTWLGGPSNSAPQYLSCGMVYVTCGCRGRESVDENGVLCGKSPWTLVDLKTAIRFLRHNAAVLPGDYDKIISVGTSAGGAMSSLIGVTGNNPVYDAFLEENGAFMDERDDVFGVQAYCPIIDLDHADAAHEWQFHNDPTCEDSPSGPAETMTPYKTALSEKLYDAYVAYYNSLGFKDPQTGEALVLGADGRSGSGYDYLMQSLEASASKYLTRLAAGELGEDFGVAEYLSGDYTVEREVMGPPPTDAQGQDVPLAPPGGYTLLRPADGAATPMMTIPKAMVQGDDKTAWLSWDGTYASITSLDDYVCMHAGRMKPCPPFDTLSCIGGENQEFGSPEQDYMHFSPVMAAAIPQLAEAFPAETAEYAPAYANVSGDEALAERRRLINPMNFIGDPDCVCAPHFRIRVGSQDCHTAFTVSMGLGLKLSEAGIDADFALVWDEPHGKADYPGEICAWIDAIAAES